MAPELRDEVVEWLSRVRADLYGAEVLSSVDPPALGVACYLCQQAAEKALKAFLTWMQTPFRRTHDIEELLRSCITLDPTFGLLLPAGATLTPYAFEFRYPGGRAEPTPEEAREALRLAREVVGFALDRLPPGVRS